jgi:shikimate dehydrogenase|tara:strand:- start:20130 stop:20870 length:741 start_codon:yes stop_codon:yes gene_type:complete
MKTFGLVGKTLTHSFSKDFFTRFFEKNQLDAEYKNFELADISEIESLLENDSLSGLNITIPYKSAVIPFLDELSLEATEIGAVNTISFKNGKSIGYNTDAFGFHQSVKPFLTFHHERALILGTGGASKAVAYVLKKLGIQVLYISRNPEADNQFAYEDINKYMLSACKLIVNCTPVGTFPNVDECPEFPFEHLSEEHLVIDLIYNPEKTKFLTQSEENGATILNGKAMLEQQAMKAFSLWNHDSKY